MYIYAKDSQKIKKKTNIPGSLMMAGIPRNVQLSGSCSGEEEKE